MLQAGKPCKTLTITSGGRGRGPKHAYIDVDRRCRGVLVSTGNIKHALALRVLEARAGDRVNQPRKGQQRLPRRPRHRAGLPSAVSPVIALCLPVHGCKAETAFRLFSTNFYFIFLFFFPKKILLLTLSV